MAETIVFIMTAVGFSVFGILFATCIAHDKSVQYYLDMDEERRKNNG